MGLQANKGLQQMVGLVKPGMPSLAAVYANDPQAIDASQLERVFVQGDQSDQQQMQQHYQ